MALRQGREGKFKDTQGLQLQIQPCRFIAEESIRPGAQNDLLEGPCGVFSPQFTAVRGGVSSIRLSVFCKSLGSALRGRTPSDSQSGTEPTSGFTEYGYEELCH